MAKRRDRVREKMNRNLVYTDVLLQNNLRTSALINKGYQYYATINRDLIQGLRLRFVSHKRREVKGALSFIKSSDIEGVVAFCIDITRFQ